MSDLAVLAGSAAARTLGGPVETVTPLAGGAVGATFHVRLSGAAESCVVKLTREAPEPAFVDEPAETRVYGARASNFAAAYFALDAAGAPLPRFWHRGALEGWRYLVLEALPGVDLRDTIGQRGSPDVEGLQAAAGDLLGRLHGVRRGHQGWIEAPPAGEGWRADFLAVFSLHRSRLREIVPTDLVDRLDACAADWASRFHGPPAFVLSHTDGLQAMALRGGAGWTFTGLVDLEDYQFTDPRFALAGHDLLARYHRTAVPKSFWEAYRAHVAVDPSYEALRPMFQAFYLTVWARVLQDDGAALARCVAMLVDIAAEA